MFCDLKIKNKKKISYFKKYIIDFDKINVKKIFMRL